MKTSTTALLGGLLLAFALQASAQTAPAAPVAPATPAAADATTAPTPVFLKKAETEALASGKVWLLVLGSNQNKVRWDIRKGGMLYGNNRTINRSDTAEWSVNDEGHICLKWRGNSASGCSAIASDGTGKYKLHFGADMTRPGSEMVLE
jgi:hypothetical protein